MISKTAESASLARIAGDGRAYITMLWVQGAGASTEFADQYLETALVSWQAKDTILYLYCFSVGRKWGRTCLKALSFAPTMI